MKKVLFLIVLFASGITNTLWAQKWQQISIGPTFSSLNYNVVDGALQHPLSVGLGIEYKTEINNITFLDAWSLGFSYSKMQSMWNMPSNKVSIQQNNGDIVFCDFSGFSENHTVNFFSLKPMAYVKISKDNKLVFGLGPSIGLVNGKWSNYGQMSTSLQDATTGVILREDIGGYGLGTFTETTTGSYSKFVIGGTLEAGYNVSKTIYLGLYGAISAIQGIKGDNPIITGVGESNSSNVTYNGIIHSSELISGSAREFGIKLGYRWGEKSVAASNKVTDNDNQVILTIRKENDDLRNQLKLMEDSIRKIYGFGLDSNNIRRVDVLVRDYARLCLAAPYDKNKYENFKKLFGMDGFATNYYKNRCKGYLDLLGQYEQIQSQYYRILETFGETYKEKKRTERGPAMEKVYQDLLLYQKDWNQRISKIDEMDGLEDVPYINNQLINSLQKMKEWIDNKIFPSWQDVKYELRIGQN